MHATTLAGDRPDLAPATTGTPVVAIVRVPAPWYVPRRLIARRMRDTIPEYEDIPGLAFKAYSFADDGAFGGLYLWTDRASAERWFGEAWHARVRRARGVDGEVRLLEAPVLLDATSGGTPADAHARLVGTVALRRVAGGLPDEDAIETLRARAAAERDLSGLVRRCYVATPDGRRGHVTLWRSRADARRALADEPRDLSVEWYDVPILTPTRRADVHIPGAA